MKAHVLTTSTSAVGGVRRQLVAGLAGEPSITSESTRFFGQPSEMKPILLRINPGTASADTESSRARARAADPGDDALDAHAEAAVRHGAVAAQVEVPLERLLRQVVLLDPLQQQIVVVEALAAADDLAVAFGREHVDAERDVGPLGIGLHVERLDRGRIAVHQHRPVELLRRSRSRPGRRSRRPTRTAGPSP